MKDKMSLEEATIKSLYSQLDDSEKKHNVEGIVDDILIVTDPEISTDEYDELIDRANEIIEDTEEGDIPLIDDYLGEYAQMCPICGSTFIEDHIVEPGTACPICLETPESFVMVGQIQYEDEVAEDNGVQVEKDVENEEPVQEQEDEEELEQLEASEQVKTSDNILTESKEDDSIEQIENRIKEINKQLSYIRRRDRVSLSIGSEEEQEELRSERAKLNGKLRKLRNDKVNMNKMTPEQQEEFKQKLKDLELWDGTEEGLPGAIQIYRLFHMKNESKELSESKENGNEYDYMLLDRLRTDCDYFLGNGGRAEKHLWAGNVKDQIAKMKEIYNSLKEKPEWLTMEDIENYEKRMTSDKVEESKKRISRSGEFDNGHVLHSWYDWTEEEAEEKAKQASIDNPNEIYSVEVDNIMNPGTGKVWFNGKSYTYDQLKWVDGKQVVDDKYLQENLDNSEITGWGKDIKGICKHFFEEMDCLSQEVMKDERGSFTQGKTVGELAEFFQLVSANANSIANELKDNDKKLQESVEPEDIENLANDIVEFCKVYDLYEYIDDYDTDEDAVEQFMKDLSTKTGVNDILTYMNSIIEDDTDEDEDLKEAVLAIIGRLQGLMSKLNESKLQESGDFKQMVEINGIKRTLYKQDEVDLFNVVSNMIKGLEDKVVNFNISFFGIPSAYIEFGNNRQSQFSVDLDTNTFGKAISVQTTYSNQPIDMEFIKLGEELVRTFNSTAKTESLERDNEEGWGDEIEEITSQFFEDVYNLSYEIKNCVRGSKTNINTVDELSEVFKTLSSDAADIADQLDEQQQSLQEDKSIKTEVEKKIDTKVVKLGDDVEVEIEVDTTPGFDKEIRKIYYTDSNGSTDFGYDKETDKFVAFDNPNGNFLTSEEDEAIKSEIHKLLTERKLNGFAAKLIK